MFPILSLHPGPSASLCLLPVLVTPLGALFLWPGLPLKQTLLSPSNLHPSSISPAVNFGFPLTDSFLPVS